MKTMKEMKNLKHLVEELEEAEDMLEDIQCRVDCLRETVELKEGVEQTNYGREVNALLEQPRWSKYKQLFEQDDGDNPSLHAGVC